MDDRYNEGYNQALEDFVAELRDECGNCDSCSRIVCIYTEIALYLKKGM